MLRALTRIEAVFTKVLDALMTGFFIIIFLIVFILVVLRYLFSLSLFGGAELVTLLFIYASSLGSALLLRNREHIRITFFLELYPLKIRKILVIVAYFFNAIFHFSLFYYAGDWIEATGFYRSAILKVSYRVMQSAIPIYALIAMLYILRNIFLVLKENRYLDADSLSHYEGS